MNWTVPQSLIDAAAAAFDSTLDQFGKDCVLEGPRGRTECPNCYKAAAEDVSAGVYKPGGPSPFPAGTTCPVCGGEGYLSAGTTRTVRMRVHENPAEWVGQVPAQVPDGLVQTRFPLAEYAAVKAAGRMRIDDEGYRGRTYELWGDPVDEYGILRSRWVVCWWRRA